MSPFVSRIDTTDFGIVASYLRNDRSPIDFLLHVRDTGLLAVLAEKLDRKLADPDFSATDFSALVRPLLEGGALRVSSRRSLPFSNPTWNLDPAAVPRLARCQAIYLPPFYCVHTPGLLEGTLLRREVGAEIRSEAHQASMKRTPR